MDEFSSLGMGFGLKPQGKAAPMSRPSISAVSNGGDRSTLFDDVFGGPPKYTTGKSTSSFSDFDYNSIFKTSSSNHNNNNNKINQNYNSYNSNRDKSASSRVSYDENVFPTISNDKENRNYSAENSASSRVSYDENVFATIFNDKENRNYSIDKSASSRVSYNDDVFAAMLNENSSRKKSVDELGSSRVSYGENVFATTSNGGLDRDHSFDELDCSRVSYKENVFATMENDEKGNDSVGLDELLENLGRSERVESSSNNGAEGFDDLLPGFGVTSPQRSSRAESESSQSKQTSINSNKPTSSVTDDPFVVLESTSPPENLSSKGFPDPLDKISKLGNSTNTKANNSSTGEVIFDNIDSLDGFGKSAPVSSEINREDSSSGAGLSNDSDDNYQELNETIFEMPSISTDSCKIGDPMASSSYVNVEFNEKGSYAEIPSESDIHIDSSDDAWLNISEIPLFTHPTSAPPPSRPPPSVPGRLSKSETGFYNSNARTGRNEFYSQSPTVESNMASPIDELENFAMGGTKHNNGVCVNTHFSEEVDTNSSASAAAMKEATDRAEAKYRQTREVREREYANTTRDGENAQVKKDEQERENSENEERLESERRQREEKERRRLERERERAREEREKARQAVERATREARERAVTEARRKSEREAVQRVQAEARRRAAEIAKEKAEKEAKERANAEIREKTAANARAEAEARCRAERASVDRAAVEARERAANAARINQQNNETARMNQQNNENARMNQQSSENVRMSQQQRNENDLESFFSTNSRPRPRDSTVDPVFQSRAESEPNNRTPSVNTTASVRKTSTAANLFDDLSSIFGEGTVSSDDFQEVDGETEERRRTRLDRHQRTQERVAKALAEKNERDLQSERDQEERHRIGEKLDIAVGDWAKGKEGNLRALLSTMQYVLWPECGWTPVSLTDLITGASVKKVYRKATLCIHPDKVQQKGANLQQKYIAEKVFDLLKEAWNKFNSEELF